MHLLYQIGDKIGFVRYEDTMVFRADQITIYETREYVVTASGLYWGNGAKIRLKVNGKVVAQRNGETVPYAGPFVVGDKISVEAINLVNTQLMLFEIK